MKTFRELIDRKPSNALQAMINGLRETEARPDFVVSMGTFGTEREGLCFGCAATCAIQKISGHNFAPNEIFGSQRKARALNMLEEDVSRFEEAMNEARMGDLSPLFAYCDVSPNRRIVSDWHMSDCDWRGCIPLVEQAIAELREMGL